MRFSPGSVVGIVTLVVALPAVSSSGAELPDEWRNWSHFREIGSEIAEGATELVNVSLPDELWEHARTDLADLRLIDDEGREVGYVLFSPPSSSASGWRSVELIDRGVVPERYSQVVVDAGTAGSIHNAIEVTLAGGEDEVFTWTEVAASRDRKNWRIVRPRAPLYRFDEEGQSGTVTIRYPRTRDRWLRLRLLDEGAELEIAKVRVGERTDAEARYRRVRRGLSRREAHADGESLWESLGSLPRMPISGVRVETEREEFHRPVIISTSEDGKSWTRLERGLVYRYADAEREDSSRYQQLEVAIRKTAAPHWRVSIMDRGDPPIDDLQVQLLREGTGLVFRMNRPGRYRLLYGNQLAHAPEYEMAQLVSERELIDAREAVPGSEQLNESYRSPEPFTERYPVLLWVALVLAVGVVGGLALRSLR